MKRRAFTLIELLMVIALIVLLMSLMVPAIRTVRLLAMRTKCQGNLKAISASLHQFYSDHQTWPARTDVQYPFEWDDAWYGQLFGSYITNPRLLYCADNSQEMAPPSENWDKTWSGPQRQFSYAVLDGMPGPSRRGDPGQPGAPNSWDVGDEQNGLRTFRRVMTDPTGKYISSNTPWVEEFPVRRPTWGTDWQNHGAPLVGDLVWERTDGHWIVNHGTGTDHDPLGMNILFANGTVDWVTPDKPNTDPELQKKQRLWRRIYKKSDTEFLRWLWNPTELPEPDVKKRS